MAIFGLEGRRIAIAVLTAALVTGFPSFLWGLYAAGQANASIAAQGRENHAAAEAAASKADTVDARVTVLEPRVYRLETVGAVHDSKLEAMGRALDRLDRMAEDTLKRLGGNPPPK